jgi:alkanesulfonate monooxygenase SsuD/methylene tetrahydromethanopterin reductase-like flavin-dependent oxidoreductase (luciferase family)
MAIQAKEFTGEIGIHYPLHVLNRYSLPELIGLAERAWQTLGKFGFSQVWTNDNLEYRSVLASSAAIVARLPVKLGTAVTVPYFRNPVDLAMAFATISELTNGREISLGLGPGSRSILRHQVRARKAARHYGRIGRRLAETLRRQGAQKRRYSGSDRLFSFECGTLRAALQNPVADPSLLWSESPQARRARAYRAPLGTALFCRLSMGLPT